MPMKSYSMTSMSIDKLNSIMAQYAYNITVSIFQLILAIVSEFTPLFIAVETFDFEPV